MAAAVLESSSAAFRRRSRRPRWGALVGATAVAEGALVGVTAVAEGVLVGAVAAAAEGARWGTLAGAMVVGALVGAAAAAAAEGALVYKDWWDTAVEQSIGTGAAKPKSVTAASPPSFEDSAARSSKAKGAIRNIEVGPDGRTPIALCKNSARKENARVSVTAEGDIYLHELTTTKGKSKDQELYPLVEFRTQHGVEILLVVREEFRVEDNEGRVLARRIQGQSYVALSRAASLEGLQVLGFDPKKVKAHPKVVHWSTTLEAALPSQ
ncbi:hypothetical protein C8T65DRAFT_701051 [Cerioporus squamosus]|nr:hypothetical protein C8T65DRAFT_701051 [Cerioporus squamosus]